MCFSARQYLYLGRQTSFRKFLQELIVIIITLLETKYETKHHAV